MKLFPPQEEVVSGGLLDSNRHLFLNMSTGSGKTYLAELAMEKVVEAGYKAVYLTPLRALAEQQYRGWRRRFAQYRIGLFTGDTINRTTTRGSYQDTQIYVMTPERLDACLRSWRSHWNWLPDVSLVVVDEFHLLGQRQRGPRLEGTMTRLLRLNPFIRFICLSATMPNTAELTSWLHGLSYTSKWRQIPLVKRIVRFQNAKEKPKLLLDEVRRCVAEGGQSLVFCNSRARAQQVAEFLVENGIQAGWHHAGLDHDQRISVEECFLNRQLQVLVATSTLEMGLNLPARQVVLYDSYAFDECGFVDLPVWSYLQRAGRAGRPGLDEKGESVLLLPRWVSKEKYEREECEPIQSQLTDTRAMAEQVLVDVYAGFSRTREALTEEFLPLTLYKAQYREANIGAQINRLVLSDLLIEAPDQEGSGPPQLRVGVLGRMAVKLMLSPETVRLIADIIHRYDRLYLLDLLILTTICEDCTPVLRTNYEELEALVCDICRLPCVFLDLTIIRLKKVLGDAYDTHRILAALKMAAICHGLTAGKGTKQLAGTYGVYAADIRLLQENVVRLLRSITQIATALHKAERALDDTDSSDPEEDATSIRRLSSMLADMVEYEISSELVVLTRIPGVGGRTARKLADHGCGDIAALAHADAADLRQIDGIGEKRAADILRHARELEKQGIPAPYHEELLRSTAHARKVHTAIDPYRLRRAMELMVRMRDGDRFHVIGGREGHVVTARNGAYVCDCMDFAEHGGDCKHILCVRLSLGEPEVSRIAKRLRENKNCAIRESLPSLWFGSHSVKEDS